MWKHGGQKAGVLALAYFIYCMITYATDNTLYYYYTNLSAFILMMYELLADEETEKAANVAEIMEIDETE